MPELVPPRRRLVRLPLALAALLAAVTSLPADGPPPEPRIREATAPQPVTLYDDEPDHPWNVAHRALFIRTGPQGREYGHDRTDPLLWESSRYLLDSPRHEAAIEVLEGLVDEDSQWIADPLRRALLQRDLWALLDWASRDRRDEGDGARSDALAERAAAAIGRLALTEDEAAALPDNYARALDAGAFPEAFVAERPKRPFLPPDLLDPEGPWIVLGQEDEPMARLHTGDFGGRSTFVVLIRLPGGREATLHWIEQANADETRWRIEGGRRSGPPLPAGTQVALLRRMNVLDADGRPMPTPVTQSIQIRLYQRDSDAEVVDRFDIGQAVFEFTHSRAALLADEPVTLRPREPNEGHLPLFRTHGFDLIDGTPANQPREQVLGRPVLQSCIVCHGQGPRSLMSLRGPTPPPALQPTTHADEFERVVEGQQQQHYWERIARYLQQNAP